MKTFPLSILNINAGATRQMALLYTFSLGSNNWYYTSAKDPITYVGNPYLPAAIDFDQFYNSGSPDDRPTTIKSGHIEPFTSFVGHDFPSILSVYVRRVWLADLTFSDLLFRGSVDNVTDSDQGLELECRGILSKLSQDFPALIVQPTCTPGNLLSPMHPEPSGFCGA